MGRRISPPAAEKTPDATMDPTERLKALLPSNPFVIPKAKVEELKKNLKVSTKTLLALLIPVAKELARPPISNYYVGAAGLGKNGNIYLGVNLEFAGFPLGQTVHAEQFVVANAKNHGETGLAALAVSAAPCGHCRQWLNELGFRGLDILVTGKKPMKLSDLLPEDFGPGDLGIEGGLLNGKNHRLLLKQNLSECPPDLWREALKAANASYSPAQYSQSPSGVAIQTRSGKIYHGSYLENAAFNPSLSPLQSALVDLVAHGEPYSAITRVVLLEKKEAKVSQALFTRALVEAIAPKAKFYLGEIG